MSDSSPIRTAPRVAEVQPRPGPGTAAPRDPLVRRTPPYRPLPAQTQLSVIRGSASGARVVTAFNSRQASASRPAGLIRGLAAGLALDVASQWSFANSDFFRPYESERFPELGTDKLSAGHTQRGWTGSPVSGAPVFAVRRHAADGTPFTVTFEIPGLNWAAFRPQGFPFFGQGPDGLEGESLERFQAGYDWALYHADALVAEYERSMGVDGIESGDRLEADLYEEASEPNGVLDESGPSHVVPSSPGLTEGTAPSLDRRRVVTDVFAARITEHDFAVDGALSISLGRELDLVVEDEPAGGAGHLEFEGESLETPVRVGQTGDVALDVASLQGELEARGGALPVQLSVLASSESGGAGDDDEPSLPPPLRRGRGDDDAAAAAREALRNVREGEQLESEVAAAGSRGGGDPRSGGQGGSADEVDLSGAVPSELVETLSDESMTILRDSEPLRSLLREGSLDVRDLESERLDGIRRVAETPLVQQATPEQKAAVMAVISDLETFQLQLLSSQFEGDVTVEEVLLTYEMDAPFTYSSGDARPVPANPEASGPDLTSIGEPTLSTGRTAPQLLHSGEPAVFRQIHMGETDAELRARSLEATFGNVGTFRDQGEIDRLLRTAVEQNRFRIQQFEQEHRQGVFTMSLPHESAGRVLVHGHEESIPGRGVTFVLERLSDGGWALESARTGTQQQELLPTLSGEELAASIDANPVMNAAATDRRDALADVADEIQTIAPRVLRRYAQLLIESGAGEEPSRLRFWVRPLQGPVAENTALDFRISAPDGLPSGIAHARVRAQLESEYPDFFEALDLDYEAGMVRATGWDGPLPRSETDYRLVYEWQPGVDRILNPDSRAYAPSLLPEWLRSRRFE